MRASDLHHELRRTADRTWAGLVVAWERARAWPFESTALAFGACAVLFWLMFRVAGDDLFNSYPIIHSDGLDYIFEGYAVSLGLTGRDVPFLPVLRNPGYVLAVAADWLVGVPGLVLFLVHAIALFVITQVLVLVAVELRLSRWLTFLFVLALLAHPMNYFYVTVLSEVLAAAWMSVSALFLFFHYRRDRARGHLVASGLCALAGSLTQTYAAIPFFVAMALDAGALLARRCPRGAMRPFLAAVTLGCVHVCLTLVWRGSFAYDMVPRTFSLLEIDGEMFPYTVAMWGYVYLGLVPVAILLAAGSRDWVIAFLSDPLGRALAGSVAAFAVLLVFYHYADARLTLAYQPLVYLALLLVVGRGVRTASRARAAAAHLTVVAMTCVLVAQTALFPPNSYFQPRLVDSTFGSRPGWFALLFGVHAVDRLRLRERCPETPQRICAAVTRPERLTTYQGQIYDAYLGSRRAAEPVR